MNLSRNVVLMCVFIASLQGSDGSRLPVSKTEKEKTLKQLEEIIHPLQNFYVSNVYKLDLQQLNFHSRFASNFVVARCMNHFRLHYATVWQSKLLGKRDFSYDITNMIMILKHNRWFTNQWKHKKKYCLVQRNWTTPHCVQQNVSGNSRKWWPCLIIDY